MTSNAVYRIGSIHCDCCGAAWRVSGYGLGKPGEHGFPCRCLDNRYCSTCMVCEDHCVCGEGGDDAVQDLRSDFYAASLVRMGRQLAGEELPSLVPWRLKDEDSIPIHIRLA
jgi:hypothetical protein